MNICISPYGRDRAILMIESGPEGHMPTCYKCPGNGIIDDLCLLVCEVHVCMYIFQVFFQDCFYNWGSIFIKEITPRLPFWEDWIKMVPTRNYEN